MPTKKELEARVAQLEQELAEAQGWHDKLWDQIETLQSELGQAQFRKAVGRFTKLFKGRRITDRACELYQQYRAEGVSKASARASVNEQLEEDGYPTKKRPEGPPTVYSEDHLKTKFKNLD